jgi:hypothetical protein
MLARRPSPSSSLGGRSLHHSQNCHSDRSSPTFFCAPNLRASACGVEESWLRSPPAGARRILHARSPPNPLPLCHPQLYFKVASGPRVTRIQAKRLRVSPFVWAARLQKDRKAALSNHPAFRPAKRSLDPTSYPSCPTGQGNVDCHTCSRFRPMYSCAFREWILL